GLRQLLVVPDIPQPFDRRMGMPPGPSVMAAPEDKQVQVHHACGHGLLCPQLLTKLGQGRPPKGFASPRCARTHRLRPYGCSGADELALSTSLLMAAAPLSTALAPA